MGKIRRLIELPAVERSLRMEAALETARAGALITMLPVRWVTRQLGNYKGESITDVRTEIAATADQVCRAVHSAAHHVPGKNACLVRGIAATRMLSRRRMPWTLYLGMARDKEDQLQAHAWVRCGEAIVTGEDVMERFSVVAKFSEGPRAGDA